jgi:hypothetical protein
MAVAATEVASLYRARTSKVDFVDVPDIGCITVEGAGPPGSEAWQDALQALFAVSYGAHFIVKKTVGSAPQVMPLEALWAVAGSPESWRWTALIVQPDPIDADVIGRAMSGARGRPLRALSSVCYERCTEGRCAQTMHVGPYSEEDGSIARLHIAIADAGYRPRGRHHEIYLGDPRRCAAEQLRTILRQPVERL